MTHLTARCQISLLLAALLVFTIQVGVAGANIRLADQPRDGKLPPEIAAAIDRPAPLAAVPGGWINLVKAIVQNRKDLEAGRITDEEAAERGGTRLVGVGRFPVFPFLYNNSGAAPFTRDDLEDQLFTGPWPTGTMQEYFKEISYNLYSVDGLVRDWYTLPQDDDYYEGTRNGMDGTAHVYDLMVEILDFNDAAIDFSQFDNDGPDGVPNTADDDGYVDFVMFVTPDVSGACGFNDNIWSHSYRLSGWSAHYETDDASHAPGIAHTRIDNYFISAGLDCDTGLQRGFGTHCHEFGHALGLPDLYDTTPALGSADSEGLGHWALMANANNNTQDQPGHMCAFHKRRMGWLNYYNVTQNVHLCIPPVEQSGAAVRVWTGGDITTEYFLVENRQRLGFDVNLHGTGLLIYHVDERVYEDRLATNDVNGDEAHKAVDLECSDATSAGHVINADHLDSATNEGDAGDVWCPATEASFTAASVPDSRSYSGDATGVAVSNIDACTGTICADFTIGVPYQADLCIQDCSTDDCAELTTCSAWWASPDIWIDNNDDGADDYPAEGIENHLWFHVKNVGPQPISGARVDLYYGDPGLGQLWPTWGTLIGSRDLPLLGLTDEVSDYIPFTYPDPPVYIDHYCIAAIAVHDLDPQNSEYPPNDNNVAQVNHQILVARAGGKEELGCPGPFTKQSKLYITSPVQYAVARVRVGSPPNFNDYSIPANWTLSFNTGTFTLQQGQRDSILVTVSSTNATHGQTAHIPFTLWDLQNNRALGGMVMDYRIDCNSPKEPQNLQVQWYPFHGDQLSGPTVRLEWTPVTADIDGQAEAIQFYQVFRADDRNTPETLIEEVAVDAEPDEAGFQWYDYLPPDCDVTYTYRVRAMDAADYPGPFSAPIELVCISSAAGESATIRELSLSQNRPNPFRPVTQIQFALPKSGRVLLEITDVNGRIIRTLMNREMNAGEWTVPWDGRTDFGTEAPAGVYFYRISCDGKELSRKMILMSR